MKGKNLCFRVRAPPQVLNLSEEIRLEPVRILKRDGTYKKYPFFLVVTDVFARILIEKEDLGSVLEQVHTIRDKHMKKDSKKKKDALENDP